MSERETERVGRGGERAIGKKERDREGGGERKREREREGGGGWQTEIVSE